jgi:hypothetical protein
MVCGCCVRTAVLHMLMVKVVRAFASNRHHGRLLVGQSECRRCSSIPPVPSEAAPRTDLCCLQQAGTKVLGKIQRAEWNDEEIDVISRGSGYRQIGNGTCSITTQSMCHPCFWIQDCCKVHGCWGSAHERQCRCRVVSRLIAFSMSDTRQRVDQYRYGKILVVMLLLLLLVICCCCCCYLLL